MSGFKSIVTNCPIRKIEIAATTNFGISNSALSIIAMSIKKGMEVYKMYLSINIGTLNTNNVTNWGLTGVMARSVGFKKDVRLSKKHNYSGYNGVNLKSFIGINGDCYDRYLIRMFEMGESLNISNFIVQNLLKIDNSVNYQQLLNKNWKKNKKNYSYMEDLIEHFLQWHTGFVVKKSINCNYIESPKGEFGVIMVANNSNKPFKCKIRSPSYFNLQSLPKLAKGHYLADLATLIGTIDIVFGEIDR